MPYQIIHTFEGFLDNPPLDGMSILLGRNEEAHTPCDAESKLRERLGKLIEGGIDGLVINLGGIGYLESTEGWEMFLIGLKTALDMNFKIWIYDEKGYPSGSAGGLVLRDYPEFEARGIKYTEIKAQEGPVEYIFREKGEIEILRCDVFYQNNSKEKNCFTRTNQPELLNQWEMNRCVSFNDSQVEKIHLYYIGCLYEGTHASRSFAEKRRYINLLDTEAVKKFIQTTHALYSKKIPDELFSQVEAFFTDEPSFMTVVLPPINETLFGEIPILDTPDEGIPILPSLPYSAEMKKLFEEKSGFKLNEIVHELFQNSSEPSYIKCIYWEVVSMVYENAFAIQLADACEKLGTKLTGHVICEDTPFENMIFHANPFRVLKHFHLPGVDLLSNKLENINIFSHKMPFSCAWLQGKKGMMSETSDFAEQRFGEKQPAKAEDMVSALSMQYILGVREFCYYYDFRTRSMGEYKRANDVMKRTCEYGGEMVYEPEIAVYCPYECFWSGYMPTSMELEKIVSEQPHYLQEAQTEILSVCNRLFYNNIQFILCDSSSISRLIESGIKKVMIPKSRVISYELLDAGNAGLIELFGHKPEFVYKSGSLEAITKLKIFEKCDLVHSIIPFRYETGMLYAAFKNKKYYCFNPTLKEMKLTPEDPVRIYDPFENLSKTVIADMSIYLKPGRAIFLTV